MRRLESMIALLMLTPVAGQAAVSCPDDDWVSVEREYRQAQFVFVGTPVSEWPDPGVEGQGEWIAGDFYRLRVEKVFGGAPLSSVDLFSENSSGRFPMQIGVSYLVFASSCKNRLYVSPRGNSGALREKQQAVAEVTKLVEGKR